MEYKHLGHSGLKVSVVGLGCMNFHTMNDEAESAAIVHAALELGVNLFDVADVYGDRGKSEEYLGRALGARRPEVVVATKFAGPMSSERLDMQGGSRRYVMQAVEASLQRLGTDYIDLYQIHFYDTNTPVEETLRALDDLVHQGKVRYIGCSNFRPWKIVESLWISDRRNLMSFVCIQNQYNLLNRWELEPDLMPLCREHGLGIMTYSPLAIGLLSGHYRRGQEPPRGTP